MIQDFSNVLSDRRILITGGTGSFGHQVLNELLNYNPKQIIIFSRDEDKQHKMRSEYRKEYESGKLKFVIGDVRDYRRLLEIFKNVDVVFHAAALKHVPYGEFHPMEIVKTNILGAHNVKEASIECGVSNLVAISTDKAVKPINAMGISKALQEKVLLNNAGNEDKITISCVRYGNVLGSRGSVMPLFDSKLSKKEPLPITHPEMTRFMLTLPQAIELVFHTLANSKGGEIFVKKSPACKIIDLAQAYAEVMTQNENYPIEIIGIRPGEKIHELLVAEEEMHRARETDTHFIVQPFNEMQNIRPDEQRKLRFYGSNNTTMLDKQGLLDMLRVTKWIQ